MGSISTLIYTLELILCSTIHITKAESFNEFSRNENEPSEAEDVQHGSDHSLDSDGNF